MNRVSLVGRLTRDAELKEFEDGNLCSFTLAVDVSKDKAIFINCQASGERANLIYKVTSKGSLIAIDGKLDQRTYLSQTGEKKVITYVRIDSVDFLEKKKEQPKEEEKTDKSFSLDDVLNDTTTDDGLPF